MDDGTGTGPARQHSRAGRPSRAGWLLGSTIFCLAAGLGLLVLAWADPDPRPRALGAVGGVLLLTLAALGLVLLLRLDRVSERLNRE